MSFSRVRSSGLWIPNSTVEPHEFEKIDRNLSRAVDGHDGGAYAPSAPIEVGGAGIRVLAPSHADQVAPKGWVENLVSNAVSALAAQKVTARCSEYTWTNQTVDTDARIALTESFADPGFTLVGPGNTDVELPSNGRYLVSLYARGQSSSSNDPHFPVIQLYRGATQLWVAAGERFSDSTMISTVIQRTSQVAITDPASQRLSLNVLISGLGTSFDLHSGGTLSIVFLSSS